jgi:hypothetical protein
MAAFMQPKESMTFSVKEYRNHLQAMRCISGVIAVGPADVSVQRIPILVVEPARFIAVFQQLYRKARIRENLLKGFVVIQNLVRIRRMIRGAGTADLHHVLIPVAAEIAVRYGTTQISAGFQELITVLRRRGRFLASYAPKRALPALRRQARLEDSVRNPPDVRGSENSPAWLSSRCNWYYPHRGSISRIFSSLYAFSI